MKMKFGIVLYDIELNGNLNGVYCNDTLGKKILTETARLISPIEDKLNREYDVIYFDVSDSYTGKLTITDNNGLLDAIWFDIKNNSTCQIVPNLIFKGQGFYMNERQIAISYKGN